MRAAAAIASIFLAGSAVFSATLERDHPVLLGRELGILQDPTGELTLAGAQHASRMGRFQASTADVPNFGFTTAVHWVRFRLTNPGKETDWLVQVDYPPLDHLELHLPDGQIQRAGDGLPFSVRPVPHRTHVFRVEVAAGRTAEYYLRVQSDGHIQFPIYAMSPAAFQRRDHTEQYAFGLYYGIILVLSVYNLILFFIVRDTAYLFYLLYISGYGLVQMTLNGLAVEVLWQNSPWWANHSLPFVIGWTFFWGLQFTRTLIDTPVHAPLLDRAVRGAMGLLLGLMVLALASSYFAAITASAVLVIAFAVLVLLAGLAAARRGYRPARYFLIAWMMLLVGLALYSLKAFGVLPANFLTEYGLQIGSALEMSLLSLGLADRIHVLDLERAKAERRTFELDREKHLAEIHSARLEIDLLKGSIQPHFILNSINAVNVWIEEDPPTAARLLSALADELRMIGQVTSKRTIPLAEEVKLCRAHLSVMSLRQDKKFLLRTSGLDGTERIPPLVLHTLVENGLTHGFHSLDRGIFRLEKMEDKRKVLYSLSNNGSQTKAQEDGSGLGLKYVRTRLEEALPGRWSLVSEPRGSGGWQILIEIQKNENPHR